MTGEANEPTGSNASNPADGYVSPLGAGFNFSDPNSPLAPYYLSLSGVITVAAIVGITTLCSLFTLWYSDIWGHIAFGRWIAATGQLPTQEPFLQLTSPSNEPIANFYWLSQSLLHHLEKFGERLARGSWINQLSGGVEILRLTLAVLVLFRLVPLFFAYRFQAGSTTKGLLAFLVAAILMFPDLPVMRPQLFGQVFFAAIMLAISLSGRVRIRWLTVPVILAIWANVHGSFLVGLGFIFLVWLAKIWDDQKIRSAESWRLFGLFLIGLLAVAALNPHGFQLFRFVRQLAGHPNVLAFSEWQPLHFRLGLAQETLFIASLGLAIWTHFRSPRGLSNGDLLILLPFAVATCMQSRMMTWWAMILPWVLAKHWQSFTNQDSTANSWDGFSFRKTMLAVLITASMLMWSPLSAWIRLGEPTPLPDSLLTRTPWQLAEQLDQQEPLPSLPWPELQTVLQKHYPAGRFQGTIYTSPTMGDYLIWRMPRSIPISLYTHGHLISAEYWNNSAVIFNTLPGWWEMLDRYETNMIIVEAFAFNSIREQIEKDPNWQVIHRGGELPNPEWGSFDGWIAIRKKPILAR
jgi:hypothetical protein